MPTFSLTTRLATLFIATWVLWLAGCATTARDRAGVVSEQSIGTGSALQMRYHAVLYYPHEISLQFPGYIVGVEKSPRNSITKTGEVAFSKNIDEQSFGIKDEARRLKTDSKLMHISHIVKNTGRMYGEGNCALYNVYSKHVDDNKLMPVELCAQSLADPSQHDIFTNGWTALGGLRAELARAIDAEQDSKQPYTHILVLVMGWNTYQSEAVRNFNSIVGHTVRASGGKFRPLFIGLTWPSMWDTKTYISQLFSFMNKKDDADEVGLSWLGALLHEVVSPLSREKGLKSIVIGHSFGARTTSIAACCGSVLAKGDDNTAVRRELDLLIGLQGAYAINRITGEDAPDDGYFPEGCGSVRHLVLTASKNDKAVTKAVATDFVGEMATYDKVCAKAAANQFWCGGVNAAGGLVEEPLAGSPRVYLNANDLITFQAFDTGGEAHSDIYRKETGVLLWNLISRLAPAGKR